MNANVTPRLYRHPPEKIVLQGISHSPHCIASNQYVVSNDSFVLYTFEHGYKYRKGHISIDPCRYEHHLSVCLHRSPDSGHLP